jgi:nitroreductase
VDEETVRRLIDAAVHAPSASNGQPWTFTVVRDQGLLDRISDAAKSHMLATLPDGPQSDRYRTILSDASFQIFYHASALILISGIATRRRPEIAVGTAATGVKKSFTRHEALDVATELGIDFKALKCDLEQFRTGLDVELEHGLISPKTNVTGEDWNLTGKIALAHLTEFPDYYTHLAVLEREAAAHLSARKQRTGYRTRGCHLEASSDRSASGCLPVPRGRPRLDRWCVGP